MKKNEKKNKQNLNTHNGFGQNKETVMKKLSFAILVAIMAIFTLNTNLALAADCDVASVTSQPNPVSQLGDNPSCDNVNAAIGWLGLNAPNCTVDSFTALKTAKVKCDGAAAPVVAPVAPVVAPVAPVVAQAPNLLSHYCPDALLLLTLQAQLELDKTAEDLAGPYDSMAGPIATAASGKKANQAYVTASMALTLVRDDLITPVLSSIPNKRTKRDQILDQVNKCLESAGFHRPPAPVAEARARYNEKKDRYDTLMTAEARDEAAIEAAKGELLAADTAWSDAITANPWQDDGFSLRFLEALKEALKDLPEQEVNSARPYIKAAEDADLSPDQRMLLMWAGMGKLSQARLSYLTASPSISSGLVEATSPDAWDGKYVTVQLAVDPTGQDGLRHGIASKGENDALALSSSDGTVIESIPADASKRIFVHSNAGSGGPSAEELLATNVGKKVKLNLTEGDPLEGELILKDDGTYLIGETPVDPSMVASVTEVVTVVETNEVSIGNLHLNLRGVGGGNFTNDNGGGFTMTLAGLTYEHMLSSKVPIHFGAELGWLQVFGGLSPARSDREERTFEDASRFVAALSAKIGYNFTEDLSLLGGISFYPVPLGVSGGAELRYNITSHWGLNGGVNWLYMPTDVVSGYRWNRNDPTETITLNTVTFGVGTHVVF